MAKLTEAKRDSGWVITPTPHGKKKNVIHYVHNGRNVCNGLKNMNEIIDTRANQPNGCIVCKIALGLASPWHKGYSDPIRRGVI